MDGVLQRATFAPLQPSGDHTLDLVMDANIGVVIAVISSGLSTDHQMVLVPTRSKADIALTRQVSMYIAHVGLGLSLTEVGRKFGRDRTTAAHACRLIEDRRDDQRFDFMLDHLESATLKMTGLVHRK